MDPIFNDIVGDLYRLTDHYLSLAAGSLIRGQVNHQIEPGPVGSIWLHLTAKVQLPFTEDPPR